MVRPCCAKGFVGPPNKERATSGISLMQNTPNSPARFSGSALVTKMREGRNFPKWLVAGNPGKQVPPPVAPLMASAPLPISWCPTPAHRDARLLEILGSQIATPSLTGSEILRPVSPGRIPMPKFVSIRPPPKISWNFSQFRNDVPPRVAPYVAQEKASPPEVKAPEPPPRRKIKPPPDTNCIGMRSRFSFSEAPAKTMTEYVGQRETRETRLQVIKQRFYKIVMGTLEESSTLYMDLLESLHQDEGIKKAASGSPGTCERMLDQWAIWENHCLSTGTNPGAPKLHQLHDFLIDARTGTIMDRGKKRQRSAIGLLRAIGWVARKAQCAILLRILTSKTITSFWEKQEQEERKETMAVPGRAIADFEWRCNLNRSSLAEVLFYGTLLLMIWGGMRFADAQRCNPHSVSLERGILRGCCWQTKTSDLGQPWGSHAFGIMARPPSWGWAHHWITAMVEWLSDLNESTRKTIDFLLPDLSLVGKEANGWDKYNIMPKPMKYMKTLAMFRKALCRTNDVLGICVASTALAAAAYSLHLKVTLLSMATQLDETPEHCADHGHHRVPS